MKNNETLNYYNKNAESFVDGTIAVDFEKTQLKPESVKLSCFFTGTA